MLFVRLLFILGLWCTFFDYTSHTLPPSPHRLLTHDKTVTKKQVLDSLLDVTEIIPICLIGFTAWVVFMNEICLSKSDVNFIRFDIDLCAQKVQ